ncbi:hypothetical protein GCM10027287_16350 [Bordetella muralis]
MKQEVNAKVGLDTMLGLCPNAWYRRFSLGAPSRYHEKTIDDVGDTVIEIKFSHLNQ